MLTHVEEIENNIQQMKAGAYVKFQQHIGGGWYISVTTGFWCVDIRKFYLPYGQDDPKPTKTGIALRLSEWRNLKVANENMRAIDPTIAQAQPCYYGEDHANQLGALNCSECYPFIKMCCD